jgi:hypothetical protein
MLFYIEIDISYWISWLIVKPASIRIGSLFRFLIQRDLQAATLKRYRFPTDPVKFIEDKVVST